MRRSLAFSPIARDGKHLSVWNATTWQRIGDLTNATSASQFLDPSMGPGGMMNALAVSSDDRVAFLVGKSRIRRWDLKHLTELDPFPIQGAVCLATYCCDS